MQISLPNFNSDTNIDTAKLVEDLLEVERQPIIRMENRIQESQEVIAIWDNIEQDMRLFQDSAKKLYSFNNPFGEREVASSNEGIVIAQAQRNATLGQYDIIVKQIASADKWISDIIPDGYEMPAGAYTCMVGDKDISFTMDGGSVDQFVELVNAQGKDLVKASIIQKGVGTDERVVLLEALEVGEKGRLQLLGAANTFGHDIGLLHTRTADATAVDIQKDAVSTFYSKEALFSDTATEGLESDEVRMVLLPGAFGTLTFPASKYADLLRSNDATILLELKAQRVQPAAEGVETPPITVQLENVVVEGESTPVLNIRAQEEAYSDATAREGTAYPVLLDKDLSVNVAIEKEAVSSGASIPLSIPAQRVVAGDTVEYTLVNPFTEYQFIVTGMQISERTDSGEVGPAMPISEAHNAIVEFNGVDIERETNSIEDIIPGVNLVLKRADATTPVSITIASNSELVKDDIITFVGTYNNLVRNLTIYTFTDIKKLRAIIEFQSQQDLEIATRDLGKLSGEFSLIRLITNLQNILTREYINRTETQLSSLRSIGIAPNLASPTAPVSSSRFLDIDEQVLEDAITNNPQGIAALFGSDTNSDVAIDYGVAYSSSETMNNYLFANGIINQRQSSLDARIRRDSQDLERANTRLARYETELRRKFGNMEQIVQELNKTSNALDNVPLFNNNNRK